MEALEDKRKRLIFRSWHRGTKEMDLLLGSFAEKHVPNFTETQLEQYDALLQENDPNLYNWISGKESLPANLSNDVYARLLKDRFAE